MRLPVLLATFFAATSAAAALEVHVVDPEDHRAFPTLQAAIDAAASGDTVLIRPLDGIHGRYAPAVVDGKALVLSGTPDGAPPQLTQISVQGLPAADQVVLQHLNVAYRGEHAEIGAQPATLRVTLCHGPVRIHGCEIQGAYFREDQQVPEGAISLTQSWDVAISDCTVRGSERAALHLDSSRCVVSDTELIGQKPPTASNFADVFGHNGAPGVVAEGRSLLYFSGAEVHGGDGGDARTAGHVAISHIYGGNGAAGAEVEAGSLCYHVDTPIEGGGPGIALMGDFLFDGAPGPPLIGVAVPVGGAARTLSASSFLDPNTGLAEVTVTGEPGEHARLLLGENAGGLRFLTASKGVVLINGAGALPSVDLGTIPASGTLTANIQLPTVAPDGARTFTLQALLRSGTTRFRMSELVSVTAVGDEVPTQFEDFIVFLRNSAPDGGDGLTWDTAFNDFHDVLDLPYSGDGPVVVHMAAGTYPLERPVSSSNDFLVSRSMEFVGGYIGAGPQASTRDPLAHPTVIDTLGATFRNIDVYDATVSDGDAARHLLMDGLTFVGDTSSGVPYIRSYEFDITLRQCQFIGNEGESLSVRGRNDIPTLVELDRCRFIGNQVGYSRGIVHINSPVFAAHPDPDQAIVRIVGCEFIGNRGGKYGPILAMSQPVETEVLYCTMLDNEPSPSFPNNVLGIGLYPFSTAPAQRMRLVGNIWRSEMERLSSLPPSFVEGSAVFAAFNSLDSTPSPWNALHAIQGDPLLVDELGPDGEYGTGDEDARLAAGSPCIDAGSNRWLLPSMTTDLTGAPRRRDDPNAPNTGEGMGPLVDVGARER